MATQPTDTNVTNMRQSAPVPPPPRDGTFARVLYNIMLNSGLSSMTVGEMYKKLNGTPFGSRSESELRHQLGNMVYMGYFVRKGKLYAMNSASAREERRAEIAKIQREQERKRRAKKKAKERYEKRKERASKQDVPALAPAAGKRTEPVITERVVEKVVTIEVPKIEIREVTKLDKWHLYAIAATIVASVAVAVVATLGIVS